ncbi:MAG: glycoside hydrolase [Actinomycetota bacterium]|nr:glycoside hydrolase [Actinomycetota bacterium]
MRRAISILLAVAFGAAALVAVVLRVTGNRDTSVGPNVLVNTPGIVDAHNSPSLARDPRDPSVVVASHRIDRPGFSAELDHSADGGRTWGSTALPLPRGLDRPYAPDVAFAPDGTLYVTYVDLRGNGNVPADLWISKSTDGGQTLSAPVRIAGQLAFQARLAIDHAGTVYVTWLQGGAAGLLSLVGPPSPIVVARSSDGGRTFSRPIHLSDPSRALVGAATPVIDSGGRLVVLYEDFKGDQRDFQNLPGPPWDHPFALVVTRPVGASAFAKGVQLEAGLVPDQRFLVYTPEFPSMAAGPRNTLYVAWADARNGDSDVFLRRSDDGGATWSPATRVNGNRKGDGTSQYLPQVGVAPDGRVDVLFLDRTRDRKHNVSMDATLASSHDQGKSFQYARLTSRSFDSRVGSSAGPQLPVDFGSRLALAGTSGRSLAAWTDTRLGSAATGRQDIFAASYSVPAAPGGFTGIPVIGVLALLTLAFAGLALSPGATHRRDAAR